MPAPAVILNEVKSPGLGSSPLAGHEGPALRSLDGRLLGVGEWGGGQLRQQATEATNVTGSATESPYFARHSVSGLLVLMGRLDSLDDDEYRYQTSALLQPQ